MCGLWKSWGTIHILKDWEKGVFAWEYTEWRNGIHNGDTIDSDSDTYISATDISCVVW